MPSRFSEPSTAVRVYTAEPGSPDHDALLLLDMTAAGPSERPATSSRPRPTAGQEP
ncbi:hypothetical protein QZN11_28300 [Streptomyces gramineus]|uniref:hypothetical protein n=1 Tax=Streptomyces gramineus TaxID=910542 RepID=UPI00398B7A45